jgi:transposase
MKHCINVGMDAHENTLVLRWAVDRQGPQSCTFGNDRRSRGQMVELFRELSAALGGARVFFAYEASSQGFGLYDQLVEAGFECAVLAPTGMPPSVQERRRKNDGRDALRVLDVLKAHVLAGTDMPAVWVPDRTQRDGRELVRARLDLSDKQTALKNQVQMLLKRWEIARAEDLGKGWTLAYGAWLRGLCGPRSPLGSGARAALATLLAQLATMKEQAAELDGQIERLSKQQRYKAPAEAVQALKGVGLLTAMVFLTELGKMDRFGNRRQVGSYLGLVPSSFESGKAQDRKGHITKHGPSRVRRVLCQASWARLRTEPRERLIYEGICARNPGHKKKGVVALMRRLAVRMWHAALEAQQRAPAQAVA